MGRACRRRDSCGVVIIRDRRTTAAVAVRSAKKEGRAGEKRDWPVLARPGVATQVGSKLFQVIIITQCCLLSLWL